MKTIHFKSIDSTNTYLKTHDHALPHMTWLSTDDQKKGKGRSNKQWFGDHHSLMCSVLLKTDLNPRHIQMLPLLAAKSLHEVLSSYHSNICIKWPNDLLINDFKLSGILVESIIESNYIHAVVIGFGVNINHILFNEEIKDIATSLSLETNQTYDIKLIYQQLINQFEKDYALFEIDTQFVIDYCNQYLAKKNKEISFNLDNQTIKAKVLYIEDNGHLLVKTNQGHLSLHSGEISISK